MGKMKVSVSEHGQNEFWFGEGYWSININKEDVAQIGKSATPQGNRKLKKYVDLLAQAPALLEALKALHSVHRGFSDSEGWTCCDDDARAQAEAAILKAEGGA